MLNQFILTFLKARFLRILKFYIFFLKYEIVGFYNDDDGGVKYFYEYIIDTEIGF